MCSGGEPWQCPQRSASGSSTLWERSAVVAGAARAQSLCAASLLERLQVSLWTRSILSLKVFGASKANASSCVTVCSFYLSALFTDLKRHTTLRVSSLTYFIIGFFPLFLFFDSPVLYLPKSLSMLLAESPLIHSTPPRPPTHPLFLLAALICFQQPHL